MEIKSVVIRTAHGAKAATAFCSGDYGLVRDGDHVGITKVDSGECVAMFYFKELEGGAEAFDDVMTFLKRFDPMKPHNRLELCASAIEVIDKHRSKMCLGCVVADITELSGVYDVKRRVR